MTYKDTHEACGACTNGTYVVYPHDGLTRCRYCGDVKMKLTTTAKGKTNG